MAAFRLTEHRVLKMGAPDAKGNYAIDWDCLFTAGPQELKLERTPPKNWSGGYGGLGLRMNAALKGWTFSTSEGTVGATNIYGKTAKWLDFSQGGGIALFDHPANPRHPTAWYPNSTMPWCTPALLFHEGYTLGAGQTLHLRYRVLVHSEPLDKAALDARWTDWAGAPTMSASPTGGWIRN